MPKRSWKMPEYPFVAELEGLKATQAAGMSKRKSNPSDVRGKTTVQKTVDEAEDEDELEFEEPEQVAVRDFSKLYLKPGH
eukprot:g40619.t1